jgi:2-isopropylmalate synthase
MEAAEGTFEPLVHEALNKATANGESRSTADITVRTQDGVHSATAAGNGPFNAVHLCLRTCPSSVYPQMADLRLTDYKVHVLEPRKGAAAKVCVLIEWSDHRKSWSTVGVSHNVTVASWNASVDAIRFELMRLTEKDDSIEKAVEDYCWGV